MICDLLYLAPTTRVRCSSRWTRTWNTGLTDTASIREQEKNEAKLYKLDRDYSVEVAVTLPPRGVTWFVIRGSAIIAAIPSPGKSVPVASKIAKRGASS